MSTGRRRPLLIGSVILLLVVIAAGVVFAIVAPDRLPGWAAFHSPKNADADRKENVDSDSEATRAEQKKGLQSLSVASFFNASTRPPSRRRTIFVLFFPQRSRSRSTAK